MSFQGSPSPTLGSERTLTHGLADKSVSQSRSDSLQLPCHPDGPSRDDWSAWVHGLDRPIAVDLFSGAGGLSLGLENAGVQVVLAVDNDEHALATHRANFPGLALRTDLSNPEGVAQVVDLLEGIDVDVLAGGPPCQPFSTAGQSKLRSLVAQGKRPAIDERIDLWSAMLEVAARIRPKAVLMENVPGLALGDDSRILRTMAAHLEEMGYSVDFRIVRASDYGVPQRRQRLIFVALRDGIRFDWPATDSCRVTVDEAIGDLPVLDRSVGERYQPYSGPTSRFQRAARAGMPQKNKDIVWDHITRPVRDDDREAFSLMTPDTKYDALPERLRRYRSDIFRDKYKRLDADDLSRTITAHLAKDGYWYIHPKEDRTLSVREAARIQTFPDRFRFSGTRSHAFRQIGNAAPPVLVATVGKALVAALDGQADDSHPESHQTLEVRRELHRKLLDWLGQRRGPWNQQGDPWTVLVSILCGRQGSADDMARAVLARWPEPGSIDGPSKRTAVIELGSDDGARSTAQRIKDKGTAQRIKDAAIAVQSHGWSVEEVAKVVGLGPLEADWLATVGLQERDLVPTTGALRVADRLLGSGSRTRSESRLNLAKVATSAEDPLAVNIALADLARTICRPRLPSCAECPVSELCESFEVAASSTQLRPAA